MMRKPIRLVLNVAVLGLLGLGGIALADNPGIVEGQCPDPSCHKVCRPTVETKQVPKRVYDDTCEEFCLPKCSFFGSLFHKSCDGDCARCEHPRKRKYLIVKIRTHEECVNKCVLEEQYCPVEPPCALPTPPMTPSELKPVK